MEPELADNPKEEHRLDKYLDHMNPEVRRDLKAKDRDYLERMRKAFSLRTRMFSAEHTRKMLMQEYGLGYSQACAVYVDMEYVFGKQEEVDKALLRRVLNEHYYTAISIAVKNTDKDPIKAAELIVKATEKIAKLNGLDEADGQLPPEMLMPPRTVIYQVQNAVIVPELPAAKEVGRG